MLVFAAAVQDETGGRETALRLTAAPLLRAVAVVRRWRSANLGRQQPFRELGDDGVVRVDDIRDTRVAALGDDLFGVVLV